MSEIRGSVSKTTLYLAIFIALLAGFAGGVGYSVFRSSSSGGIQSQIVPHEQEVPDAPISRAELANLEKKANQDPDNPQAWINWGNALSDSGQDEEAIAAYTRALALDPKNHDVRTDLGVAYFNNDKPQEAIAEFDRVLSVDPKHPQARFNKGVVLFSGLNEQEAAMAEWKKLLELHPDLITPAGISLKDFIQQVRAEQEGEQDEEGEVSPPAEEDEVTEPATLPGTPKK